MYVVNNLTENGRFEPRARMNMCVCVNVYINYHLLGRYFWLDFDFVLPGKRCALISDVNNFAYRKKRARRCEIVD